MKLFKPSCKIFLLTVPRRHFFYGSFVLFMSCVCHAFASVQCCLVVTCWERADLLLLFVMFNCVFVTFPYGILGLVWYLIISIPDLCCLSYFNGYAESSLVIWVSDRRDDGSLKLIRVFTFFFFFSG